MIDARISRDAGGVIHGPSYGYSEGKFIVGGLTGGVLKTSVCNGQIETQQRRAAEHQRNERKEGSAGDRMMFFHSSASRVKGEKSKSIVQFTGTDL